MEPEYQRATWLMGKDKRKKRPKEKNLIQKGTSHAERSEMRTSVTVIGDLLERTGRCVVQRGGRPILVKRKKRGKLYLLSLKVRWKWEGPKSSSNTAGQTTTVFIQIKRVGTRETMCSNWMVLLKLEKDGKK